MNRFWMPTALAFSFLMWVAVPVAEARQAAAAADEAKQAALFEAIDGVQQTYLEGVAQLGRDRLSKIQKLAESSAAELSAEAWEIYFQLTIDDDLYVEAEPAANQIIAQGGKVSPSVWLLSRIVDLVAKVDRGAYKESVEAIRKSLDPTQRPQAGAGEADETAVPIDTVISLLEVYYQRLLGKEQYATAAEAFQLIRQSVKDEGVQLYLDQRLARLALMGKPAPPIAGTDLGGNPVSLADYKGKVVLVLFWASWCLPSAEKADDFLRIYYEFHDKGLEVVGINLDTLDVEPAEIPTIMPNVNRFLLDYNISWPNVLNGQGAQNFAEAYKITDLPANVLIDKEGKVAAIDADLPSLVETLQERLGK